MNEHIKKILLIATIIASIGVAYYLINAPLIFSKTIVGWTLFIVAIIVAAIGVIFRITYYGQHTQLHIIVPVIALVICVKIMNIFQNDPEEFGKYLLLPLSIISAIFLILTAMGIAENYM